MTTSNTFRNAVVLLILVLFAAAKATAQDAYEIGVGDRVSISVYGQDDMDTDTEVAADGTITMALIGRVDVEGMTPPEISRLLESRLENEGYLRNANVNVVVDEYRSNTVSVLGNVNQPGKIALQGPTTLTEVLALAGGINSGGGERLVLVREGDDGKQVRHEYYLSELLDRKAANEPPVRVEKGDTLYVPKADQFYIHGQVQKPGTYPIDRSLNVMQALSVSGGFNPRAKTSGVVLYRKQSDGTVETREVDMTDPVRDGDVLFVKESLF
ncbi:MAG: polysaccharide biosynthesis/export family protein [Marinobacter sp.]